jgi:hypothetical protein
MSSCSRFFMFHQETFLWKPSSIKFTLHSKGNYNLQGKNYLLSPRFSGEHAQRFYCTGLITNHIMDHVHNNF